MPYIRPYIHVFISQIVNWYTFDSVLFARKLFFYYRVCTIHAEYAVTDTLSISIEHQLLIDKIENPKFSFV